MRWNSPFVLATTGTIAIHLVFAVCAGAIVAHHRTDLVPPARRIEIVNIEVPNIVKPRRPVPESEPAKQDPVTPIKQARVVRPQAPHAEPLRTAAPPPPPGMKSK